MRGSLEGFLKVKLNDKDNRPPPSATTNEPGSQGVKVQHDPTSTMVFDSDPS